MVKQLQPAENRLLAAAHKSGNLPRPQKAVLKYAPDNHPVTFCQLYWDNLRCALETRVPQVGHCSIVARQQDDN